MYIFRFFGDMSHMGGILVLLLKLRASKSAAGISLKTQELFMVVFVTRYMDLFFRFYSWYNSIMKVLYLSLTGLIIYMIRKDAPIKATYDKSQDYFLHWKFAVAPCAALGFIIHSWTSWGPMSIFLTPTNYFWILSEVLEPLAIVPQLMMLKRYRDVENQPGLHVFLLATYRSLYILNWVWRAYHEIGYRHYILIYFAGLVQTLLYAVYFYFYAISQQPANTTAGTVPLLDRTRSTSIETEFASAHHLG